MNAAVLQRLHGYRRRIAYEWRQRQYRQAARRRISLFNAWLDQLRADPPEVLLGANFAAFGGVRHHIQAIQRYSSLRVGLAPSEELLRELTIYQLTHQLKPRFQRFSPEGIRVLHSHVFPWFIDWCSVHRNADTRWVHTYHLHYYPEHGDGKLQPWQEEINKALRETASKADLCLSVSRWQVDELAEQGIDAEYLPNGIDVALCDRANPRAFVDEYGISDFILYVGRMDPVKNPADFVRLAKLLPGYEFVMIGAGLDRETILNECRLEVPKNLHVLGPFSHAKVQDAVAACRVLVATSRREGLPTLVMEGMAHGKAVVVPDEIGCMEVIGDTGFIYKRNDLDDLGEKTLMAWRGGEENDAARKRVLNEYDWSVVISRLDDVYRKLAT